MEKQPLNPGVEKPPAYTPVDVMGSSPLLQQPTAPAAVLIPPSGYYAAGTPPINFVPSYGSTQSTAVTVERNIIIVGGCPACRVGVMEDDYTCLGLLCAILFFPIGIICCLLLKSRRCSHCGAYFD